MTHRRVANPFEGWALIGLMFLPSIPLWFFWETLISWGSETVAGVVICAQIASVLLLREPLLRWIDWLSTKLGAQHKKRKSGSASPAKLIELMTRNPSPTAPEPTPLKGAALMYRTVDERETFLENPVLAKMAQQLTDKAKQDKT